MRDVISFQSRKHSQACFTRHLSQLCIAHLKSRASGPPILEKKFACSGFFVVEILSPLTPQKELQNSVPPILRGDWGRIPHPWIRWSFPVSCLRSVLHRLLQVDLQ